jgi:hypothetical protein
MILAELGPYVGPAVLVGLVGFASLLIWAGFRNISLPRAWAYVIGGALVLALVCTWLGDMAGAGNLGGPIAFVFGLPAVGVAWIVALWMLWKARSWRKTGALLLAVIFPTALFLSIQLGDMRSPESLTQRNGTAIVEGLRRYRADRGAYPAVLDDLVPGYLLALPEAITTQQTGWLYGTTGGEFTLGYWYYPDKLGSIVCLYTSAAPRWECGDNHWGPFTPVWTPAPTEPARPSSTFPPLASTPLGPTGTPITAASAGRLQVRARWTIRTPGEPGLELNQLAFLPDGLTLAIVDGVGDLSFWDVASGTRQQFLAGWHVRSVAFSADGEHLAIVDGRDALLWEWRTGEKPRFFADGGYRGPVQQALLTPDGTAVMHDDSYHGQGMPCSFAVLAPVDEGPAIRTFGDYCGWAIMRLVLSQDGRYLAIAANDGSVRLSALSESDPTDYGWSGWWSDGKTASTSWVYDVAFSPDGRLLVWLTDRGTPGTSALRYWDLQQHVEGQFTAGMLTDQITFSPDSSLLAAASGNTVRLIEVSTGAEIAHLRAATEIRSIVFAPSGDWLATGLTDGSVWFWGVQP